MARRLIVFVLIFLFLFSGSALAASGEVIFTDVVYGAAIGAVVGGAVYLVDQDHLGEKMGIGILVGAVGGLVLGVSDVGSLVQIQNNEVKVATPTINIQDRKEEMSQEEDVVVRASILGVRF
ncbi:MAG: hypothetical protein P8Y66_04335 [Nitrospirota bacterium]|jgi:hypothetical protein